MTINKADEKELGSLHGALAKILRDSLQQEYTNPDTGERIPPPAAILNVARQFLKDNKIEAIGVTGSALHDLSDLPIFEDSNIIPMRKTN
jgi:hypothetical protein